MEDEIIYNLNQKLDVALERGKKILDDDAIQERIEYAKNMAEVTIRKHPVKSVVIGLAIGFLIGKIVSGDD